MEDGWGVEKADFDSMLIYGGAWTVQVPCTSTETPVQPHVELDLTGCDPANGRVRIVRNKDAPAKRLSNNVGREITIFNYILWRSVVGNCA